MVQCRRDSWQSSSAWSSWFRRRRYGLNSLPHPFIAWFLHPTFSMPPCLQCRNQVNLPLDPNSPTALYVLNANNCSCPLFASSLHLTSCRQPPTWKNAPAIYSFTSHLPILVDMKQCTFDATRGEGESGNIRPR